MTTSTISRSTSEENTCDRITGDQGPKILLQGPCERFSWWLSIPWEPTQTPKHNLLHVNSPSHTCFPIFTTHGSPILQEPDQQHPRSWQPENYFGSRPTFPNISFSWQQCRRTCQICYVHGMNAKGANNLRSLTLLALDHDTQLFFCLMEGHQHHSPRSVLVSVGWGAEPRPVKKWAGSP